MIASVAKPQAPGAPPHPHGPTPEEQTAIDNFWELRRRADAYYAYSYIHAYIQEPFTTLLPEHVFNCALYLWNILASSAFSGQSTGKMLFPDKSEGGPDFQALTNGAPPMMGMPSAPGGTSNTK